MKRTLLFVFLALSVFSFTSDPDAECLFKNGEKNFSNKEYLKAIHDFTAAISIRPNYGRAYLMRAKAKMLFHQQIEADNTEFCFDLVQALQLGESESEELLHKSCKGQCHDMEKAFIEPDMVFCADFSSKVLTELPKGTEKMTNVFRLNLFNNKLTDISSAFSAFPVLLSLDLSSNRIKSISKLPNLRELNLSKNQLSVLPNEIGGLTKIKSLDLHGNQLADLPCGLANCTELEHLDLSFNHFSTLPKEVLLLKKLKTLRLSGNTLDRKSQRIITESLQNTEIYF